MNTHGKKQRKRRNHIDYNVPLPSDFHGNIQTGGNITSVLFPSWGRTGHEAAVRQHHHLSNAAASLLHDKLPVLHGQCSILVTLRSVGDRKEVCGSPPPPWRANRSKVVIRCRAEDTRSWEVKIRNLMVWRMLRVGLVQNWMGQGLCPWTDVAWRGSSIAIWGVI